MNPDQSLRAHLKKILGWEDAHVGFDAAVFGLSPSLRGVAPKGFPHSPWQLLEHIRRTQADILDFGQTYLRELLLVADHNAYHVGQLVAVRQGLGAWK